MPVGVVEGKAPEEKLERLQQRFDHTDAYWLAHSVMIYKQS